MHGVLYNSETCSESPICDINSESNDQYVTSTLAINVATSLNISCVVNQNLTISASMSDVEIRVPPTRRVKSDTVYVGKNQIIHEDSFPASVLGAPELSYH